MICEVGKAVGAEGLVAGQIVDIKSEGLGEQARLRTPLECCQAFCYHALAGAC